MDFIIASLILCICVMIVYTCQPFHEALFCVAGGGYEINLDHRKLRTPQGSMFKVPNEALAMAVSQEWSAQKETIKRHNMHMVGLV